MATSSEPLVELLESTSIEAQSVERVDQPEADEADEADEWEEGSLPAAPTVPFFTKQDFINATPQPDKDGHVVQSRISHQQASDNHQYGPRRNGRPGRLGSSGLFTTGNEQAPYRHEIRGVPSRRRGIETRQFENGRTRVDNAAYASRSRGEPPGGEYIFSQYWSQLLSDLYGDDTRGWAREELSRLSRQTHTFIATPSDHSNTALIWGDSTQVTYARSGLEEFERSIRKQHAEKRKDFGRWEKINAVDGRREHREERKAKIDEIVAQHGKLESSAEYKYEYWFLWPSQDLEFEQIGSSKLQSLRKSFRCVIDYDSKTSFVRIIANDERELLQVVQRLVNLVKEMIAELNQVSKVNLLEPPSKCAHGCSVSLGEKDSVPAMPMLGDRSISATEAEHWEDHLHGSRRSNRKEVDKAIERCLKSLRLSEKHVRMRVKLGQLALKQYQLPLDGSKQYNFDDFHAMIEKERTLLEFHGLLCGADTDAIVDRCANHPMFVNPTETHTAHIDFKEPDKRTTLRLEKKFAVSPDYREGFLEEQYWLEFPSGSEGSLLEINMLDFENLDWRMTINAASFSETAKASQQHDRFRTNVTLKLTSDDSSRKPKLKGKPQRRVFFGLDGPKPTLVTELITIAYDIQDCDAKFELTRKDEYQQTQYGTEAGPPVSTLFASYYYPHWDNHLGSYADLPPGGQVEWQPSLSTFFPVESGQGRAKGLEKFMKEIRQVQRVLAGKPAETDSSPLASLLTDFPDGVGNAKC